jgi:hypothetical protein
MGTAELIRNVLYDLFPIYQDTSYDKACLLKKYAYLIQLKLI